MHKFKFTKIFINPKDSENNVSTDKKIKQFLILFAINNYIQLHR